MTPPADESPLVSVITVVRNDRLGLDRTRTSLRRQTCRRFEWVAVDGASTDGTASYLAAHTDELAWWRSATDHGPYDAMNIGLAVARAPYVMFLNAGDGFAEPDTLARLVPILETERPDFLYGDSYEDTGSGLAHKPARSHQRAWYGMFTHHQAMLYRRSLIAKLVFDPRFPIGADYAFTLDTLAAAIRLRRIDWPLATVAAPGLSARYAARGRRDQLEIRRARLNLPLPINLGIVGLQWAALGVRRRWPDLYRRLRSKAVEKTTILAPHPGCLVPD